MCGELLLTNSSLARMREEKREQRHKNCEIGYEVSWEAPVLAGVTETAAGDVESANFCAAMVASVKTTIDALKIDSAPRYKNRNTSPSAQKISSHGR